MARTARAHSLRSPAPSIEDGKDPLDYLLRQIARLPAVLAFPLAIALAPFLVVTILVVGFVVGLIVEPVNAFFGYSVSAGIVWVFLAYLGVSDGG